MSGQTPSSTIGPFFAVGLPWDDGSFVVPAGTPDGVWVRGLVLDGAGEVVPDALVETWQADGEGYFVDAGQLAPAASGFRGFGRSSAEATGEFELFTVKPAAVEGPEGRRLAPHIDVSVFARGLLKRLVTRMYFPDEEVANAADPILGSIGDPEARATLIAARADDGYRFDIRLQGERETVFFEL
jgi:protocatechuate 3,4-dioxygenase alpha subunit